MNRFVRLLSAFSSCTAVLAIGSGAFAQLNVGQYGVQPGLESEYLQYQLSGQDLSQMRTIPAVINSSLKLLPQGLLTVGD